MKAIGGQAVIEGVMMKSPDKVAIAVRKKNKILVKRQKYHSVAEKYKILKLPILRGIVYLIEMLVIGTKALTWSADQQAGKSARRREK